MSPILAQNHKIMIEGRVKDGAEGGVFMPGVQIQVMNTQFTTTTDTKGNFKLALPFAQSDSIALKFKFFGYIPFVTKVKASPQVNLGIVQLKSISTQIVEISSSQIGNSPTIVKSPSYDKITTEQAKLLPQLMGETDLLRLLQLRPGISTSGDGSSSLYVRGGGPDQNLIMLDGAPIYNPNHLFGFFSVFNGDAIKDVTLYKAGFPGRFGGRLSSVIDIRSNTGSQEKSSVSASLGLISSRIQAETPFAKNKGSVSLSVRRTYLDIFTRLINSQNAKVKDYEPLPDYYFYDLNIGAKYQATDRDIISVTALYGQDVLSLTGQDGFSLSTKWGNQAATLHWDHICNKKLLAQYKLTYSGYTYQTGYDYSNFKVKVGSSVRDFSGSAHFLYEWNDKLNFEYGVGTTYNSYVIGQTSASSGNQDFNYSNGKFLSSINSYGFVQAEVRPIKKLMINGSLRFSHFSRAGQQFHGFEPRAIADYKINDRIDITAAFSHMYQYMHLIGNSGSSLPSDVWYPSGTTVSPQSSTQVSAGWMARLGEGNSWYLSNDYYYKSLARQIDFKDGAGTFSNTGLDSSFIFGKGWAYGGEFFLEKKKGRTTGWIGYTLSWSWRQFDAINNGEPFHPRYDRRHDMNVVVVHRLNTRISLSATWIYGSGNYITLPQGRYLFQDVPGTISKEPGYTVLPDIAKRNSFRMAAYHRMDISITYKMQVNRGNSTWNFSLFNIYNRKNPYFIYFQNEYANADKTGNIVGFSAQQVSLIPILPSLSYTRSW